MFSKYINVSKAQNLIVHNTIYTQLSIYARFTLYKAQIWHPITLFSVTTFKDTLVTEHWTPQFPETFRFFLFF